MNIVFFSNKSLHGVYLLNNLKEQNIILKAIFIDEDLVKKNIKERTKHYLRQLIPRYILNLQRKFRKIPVAEKYQQRKFYKQYSLKVYAVSSFNSEACRKKLEDIKPDLIVLGGSRILKEHARLPAIPSSGHRKITIPTIR